MERSEAITQMRATCDQLSVGVTRLHPQVPKLQDAAAQAEILKALFELTRQIEVVKKHLLRLEKGSDTRLL